MQTALIMLFKYKIISAIDILFRLQNNPKLRCNFPNSLTLHKLFIPCLKKLIKLSNLSHLFFF